MGMNQLIYLEMNIDHCRLNMNQNAEIALSLCYIKTDIYFSMRFVFYCKGILFKILLTLFPLFLAFLKEELSTLPFFPPQDQYLWWWLILTKTKTCHQLFLKGNIVKLVKCCLVNHNLLRVV